MAGEAMERWYEHAIIYEVPVQLFNDSDGDGVGDVRGLTRALDYLATLGVTCVWLPPFLVSPHADGGYDISDYYRIDPRLGSQGDFVRFLRHAQERGLRVIIDVAFNHTSVEHPWFSAARRDRTSKYRDFYIWSDDPITSDDDRNVVGAEGVWTFDEEAGQYYHHTFFPFQPDLNLANEAVRDEIMKALEYWIQLGVSGFRLDAVSIMLKPKPGRRRDGDPHRLLAEMRELVAAARRDVVLIAEGDVGPDGIAGYFGSGDRLHMALDFFLASHLAAALAKESAEPLRRALQALPEPPLGCALANFLRSHDELSLRQLPEDERSEVTGVLARDARQRIFGTGIRRRLAPLLRGDGRRIRLAHSLLLSMPGTPVLYYGDEIGMGDDLRLEGRDAVRTPMQWSDGRHAGFSDAAAADLVAPVVSGGRFGYERVNVADQRRDPDSLLNWMMAALRARRGCPEFGLSKRADVLETGDPRVLAHVCRHRASLVLALHNLSDEEVEFEVDLSEMAEYPLIEMLADRAYPGFDAGPTRLEPYGFRWFRSHEFPA